MPISSRTTIPTTTTTIRMPITPMRGTASSADFYTVSVLGFNNEGGTVCGDEPKTDESEEDKSDADESEIPEVVTRISFAGRQARMLWSESCNSSKWS